MEKHFTLKELSVLLRRDWLILAARLSMKIEKMRVMVGLMEDEMGAWNLAQAEFHVTDPHGVIFREDRVSFFEKDYSTGCNMYLDLPYAIINDEVSVQEWAENYVAGLVKAKNARAAAREIAEQKAAKLAETHERQYLAALMAKYPDMVPCRE